MRVVAILQARTSSSRLPGKVLLPILGRPMLEREIERLQQCTTLDGLVVATSGDGSDDLLAATCRALGVAVHRGSLDDVLDRFRGAAEATRAEIVVRVTGDCPLIDPDVLDAVVAFRADGSYDYASNTLRPTYPDGLDVEVFRRDVLDAAWREATLRSDREHVTPFLYRHPERFRLGSFCGDVDRSALRWTVDEPRDYDFAVAVYERLYPRKPRFRMVDVLALLERESDLGVVNRDIMRNEGYRRSLQADEAGSTPGSISGDSIR